MQFDPKIVRYCIYQREICPESKREHYQGYIEFFDNLRIGQVKAVLGECHVEPRQGSRTQAREYARKEESAIPATQVEFGLWNEDASRKRKLCDILKEDITLDDIAEQYPAIYVRHCRGLKDLFNRRLKRKAFAERKVTVVACIGPTCTGKTTWAHRQDVHLFSVPVAHKLWFDGYEGEKTILIDEFYGDIRYDHLLRILRGFRIQVPYKGGFVPAFWNKVIITSNKHPDSWYPKKGIVMTPALAARINEIRMFVVDPNYVDQ